MKLSKKKELERKRRWRIRKKVSGTAERPRLAVRFTNKNVHAQCIDDEAGFTLLALSTNSKDFGDVLPNVEGATKVGKAIGERAKKAEISSVVFDRAGRKYHGCVKAFADAARDAGLQF
tara:strand:+ start:141 stop:497 length:357 start_codon:yes stop_codon:yes gene_type:complete